MIRVLHTEWSDGWGGQEIRIINEMLAMKKLGVEVYLACRERAKIREKAEESGIKVFVLPFKGNTDLKTLFQLARLIKKYNINIVNTHSGKDTWVGGFAAKLTGAKFIRTRHLSNAIRTSRLNFINEMADFIFTTGESVRVNMIRDNRIQANKIQSVPTGMAISLFNPKRYNRTAARQRFGFSNEDFVVGNVAVLRRFKRHDRFLEVIRYLVIQCPEKNIKAVIAGDGPQMQALKQQIEALKLEQHVRLLGHVDNVPEFLQAIDLFVLTSDSGEGVPQSVIQALLMEKAVVATNAGSTKDLFQNDNFKLVDKDDSNAIKQACHEMIKEDAIRKIYQSKARQYIANEFSEEKMAENIIAVYKKLLVI